MKLVALLMLLTSSVVWANDKPADKPQDPPKEVAKEVKASPHDAMRLHFLGKRPYVAPPKK